MANADEHLNQWLRDAHAMEQQAEEMLSAQASRLEHYPVLRGRIQEHLEETRSQRQRLETCMQRRGVSPSAMKDFAAKVTAVMAAKVSRWRNCNTRAAIIAAMRS